jgi:hypothetical protein
VEANGLPKEEIVLKMTGVLQTMDGLDASRRVAWAKYYELLEANQELLALLEELSNAVMFHPRIHSDDKIIELARKCLAF